MCWARGPGEPPRSLGLFGAPGGRLGEAGPQLLPSLARKAASSRFSATTCATTTNYYFHLRGGTALLSSYDENSAAFSSAALDTAVLSSIAERRMDLKSFAVKLAALFLEFQSLSAVSKRI